MGTPALLIPHAEIEHSVAANVDTDEDFNVEQTPNFETASAAALVLAVLTTGGVLLGLFVREWQQEKSYRSWILLACVAPLR